MIRPRTERRCAIFYCDKARERICCVDCHEKCKNACLNHPSRCGQVDKIQPKRQQRR